MRSNGAVSATAAAQYGAVTRAQLRSAGITTTTIDRWLSSGKLLLFQPGTYLIPGSDPSWERDVTTRHGTDDGRARPFNLHRARTFTPDDIVIIRRIPVTRAERTLVDLAGVLPLPRLEAALDAALLRPLATTPDIRTYIGERHLGRNRGVGVLMELIHDRENGVLESELEREFLRVCKRFRLPDAQRQPYVGPFRVDFTYADLRILIELDGRATHGTAQAFEEDRVRDNVAAMQGWTVRLRFTWRQMKRTPEYVANTIHDALSLARA